MEEKKAELEKGKPIPAPIKMQGYDFFAVDPSLKEICTFCRVACKLSIIGSSIV